MNVAITILKRILKTSDIIREAMKSVNTEEHIMIINSYVPKQNY